MKNSLTKYLSKYQSLTKEEVSIIEDTNLIREYQKGAVLLKEGQIAEECFLVLNGCVRSYYLFDGHEKTTEFYTELQPITPISYVKKLPSEYYLECIEDVILSVSNNEKTIQFLKKYPQFTSLITTISNDVLANKQLALDDFKNLSPEERYLELLNKRPDLINRVPQHQLASFLGIQPQSLSRIRKRILEKNK